MPDTISAAREIASSARFSAERGQYDLNGSLVREHRALSVGRKLGLEVSRALVPLVDQAVVRTCEQMGLKRSDVRAFVHSSAEIEAACSISESHCVVEISSTAVDLLSESELTFVIGHELGHFLLDHHYIPMPPIKSAERYMVSRAREISADRLGLIACGSVDDAMRAILKTFSGLSEDHLRFDSTAFLSESLSEENRSAAEASLFDTHPSFAVRARCLIKFSTILEHWQTPSWPDKFMRTDDSVSSDFVEYGERRAQSYIAELIEECDRWIWLAALSRNGSIDSKNLDLLTNKFGAEFVSKIRNNFNGTPKQQVLVFVSEQVASSQRAMKTALPIRFSAELGRLISDCESSLKLGTNKHPLRFIEP